MLRSSFTLLFILTALPLHAATLSGFVRSTQDGESLAYATVRLAALPLGTQSNGSGYYAIKNVPLGTHVVVSSHIGYTTRLDTVHLGAADTNVRLDLSLAEATLTVSEEMVITTQRYSRERDAQPGYLSLQSEPLRQMPAIGEADLLRSLQLLPGIQSASDISSGLYIRGGGPDQTRILLDQIPLYNPSHAFGFFSTFNPDAIKDVNLYKGAYPATYGGTLGSVLDVSNREGNNQTLSGRGSLSLISGRLLLEGPVGSGAWMLASRRTYIDPVLAAVRSRGVDVPNYFFYDFNGKINQRLSPNDTFSASTYWGQDDLGFDFDAENFVSIRWGNRALSSRWDRILSPSLFGTLVAAGSYYESNTALSFLDTPIYFFNSVRDLSLKGDLDYFAGSKHTLSAGFLLTFYEFHFEQAFNRQSQVDFKDKPTLFSLYLQDEWRPLQPTLIRLGTRTTYFSEGQRWHWAPRLALSHDLTPQLRLKLGGGTYRQYLQLVTTEGFSGGDFWLPIDRTATPSRSYQGIVGGEWEPSRRYQFTIEAYYTDMADLVVLDNEVSADSDNTRTADLFKTGGSGYATGVEFFLQRRSGSLTGWIGYTLGWTRRRFAELNSGRTFSPKYDRRHDLSFSLSYRRGIWTFGSNFLYATGQAFTPAAARYTLRQPATGEVEDYVLPAGRNSARLLPYHRLDLSATRAFELWGQEAELYLQIFNLYSRRNEWFVQYDTDDPDTEPKVAKMLPVVPSLGLNFKF